MHYQELLFQQRDQVFNTAPIETQRRKSVSTHNVSSVKNSSKVDMEEFSTKNKSEIKQNYIKSMAVRNMVKTVGISSNTIHVYKDSKLPNKE